jgi:hypothetical protein
MKHTEGKIEGQIFEIILAGTFDADKTGWIHGVGRLALDWAGTNERVGVRGKNLRRIGPHRLKYCFLG